MKYPLVTVYITNYNYGKYIQKAIDSVFSQTLRDWELIIIDDGSTDGSKNIIEQYSGHENIKVIFQKNRGLNVTNNIAIRVSRGKYIMRLDADDYLDENALLVMSNKLESDSHLGLVFPDYFLIDADGHIMNVERRNSFKDDVKLLDQPAHGACTMIRKEAIENVGGYDEEFKCQDGYELWVKFTAKYEVENISTPLFFYRQHGSNLTTNENRILSTRAKIKEKYLSNSNKINGKTLAIIPIRGAKFNSNHLAFKEVNELSLLEKKIHDTIDASNINIVVVSSPDDDVELFVTERFKDNPNLIFHKRRPELAQLNIGLASTVSEILNFDPIKEIGPDLLAIVSVEYPFCDRKDIDDAINTIKIFETDSLISVRKDNNVYYQHHGAGMKAILGMDKFSKLEREILYQYAGGIIIVKTSAFLKSDELITGKVGHTVISQKSAFRIQTDFDLKLAEKMVDL